MAGTGLPLASLFGGEVKYWGIASGLIGLALVWWGRYAMFEKICAALVGLMFLSMVGAAVLTVPNLPELLRGLVPTIPQGAMVNVLSVAGGVGGTITLAADRIPREWRNSLWSNVWMVICAVLFIALAATELQKALGNVFG